MTLTKAHIIQDIADQNGYTNKLSTDVVETLLEIIKRSLTSDADVMISNFGKFCVKAKRERKGRNSATGKSTLPRSLRVVTFKWSAKLRDRINR